MSYLDCWDHLLYIPVETKVDLRRMRVQDNDNHARHWVAVWTAMPQVTEPDNLPMASGNGDIFADKTLRQTLKLSLDTDKLRIRISNAFGLGKLSIVSMTVARPAPEYTASGSPKVECGSMRTVTFGGRRGITIPDAALAISDEVTIEVLAGESITVSMYLAESPDPAGVTGHPGSRTTSWLAPGDQTQSPDLNGERQAVDHWYFLSTIESHLSRDRCAFVLVGDSITDGRCSTTNGNDRWPDLLSRRMQSSRFAKSIAVVNQGAGGNRLLLDGLGPNAWSRIMRDVIGQPGVRYALIFEGVNDIGTAADTTQAQEAVYNEMITAYQQMIAQIRAHDIVCFGATILPFSAKTRASQPYSSPLRNQTRVKINQWILDSGAFDYVVDFASALAKPANSSELDSLYDSGDFLHPNVAGFQKLAESFDIEAFERCQRP